MRLLGGIVCVIVSAWAAGCAQLPLPAPTPIPTATRRPFPTVPSPPPTPTPRSHELACQFPLDYDGDGRLESGGIYSFSWQGTAIHLVTGAGNLELSAPAGLAAGRRDLIMVFSGPLPNALELPSNLPPGGSALFDPARLSAEHRDENGRPFLRRLEDSRSDGLFAINQDILRVEQALGPGEAITLTVVLRGRRGIQLETQYEAWRLALGEETYEYRVARSGRVTSLHGPDPDSLQPYDGLVTFAGSSLSYGFPSGGGAPFSASTYTTAVTGDVTGTFPLAELERLFLTARAACGQ